MLDCVITVPGGGSGQGCLKKPKTGKVSELIKDLEAYYKAIYRHCLECRACDPNEILKRFLENRDRPTPNRKEVGTTTALLVDMAARYVKNVPGTDKKWLREYLIRCSSMQVAIKHRQALTQKELVELAMKDTSRDWMQIADDLPEDDFLRKSIQHAGRVHATGQQIHRGQFGRCLQELETKSRRPERIWAFKAIVLLIEAGCAPDSVEELKKMMPIAETMAT